MNTAFFRTAMAGAAFLVLNRPAQAHPGHFALDWFSAPPHAGHGGEYATFCLALALTALLLGAGWLATRRR